jgi:hypothetical protein
MRGELTAADRQGAPELVNATDYLSARQLERDVDSLHSHSGTKRRRTHDWHADTGPSTEPDPGAHRRSDGCLLPDGIGLAPVQ